MKREEREGRPTPRQFFKGWVKWLIKRRQSVRLFKRGAMTATLPAACRWHSARPWSSDNRVEKTRKRKGREGGSRVVAYARLFSRSSMASSHPSASVTVSFSKEFSFFLSFSLLAVSFLSLPFFLSLEQLERRGEPPQRTRLVRALHLQLGAICPQLFTTGIRFH